MEDNPITHASFVLAGRFMTGRRPDPNFYHLSQNEMLNFRAHFGVSPVVAAKIWSKIDWFGLTGFLPKHLLWGLMLMRVYATEKVLSAIAGVDPKTFRKWAWKAIRLIVSLENDVIRWGNRHRGNSTKTAKTTVDGTDCPIEEPSPFNRKWYSHKFKGPGLRYEVAVCIKTGDIVWIFGPFPCGSWPDIKIFRLGLKHMLPAGEMVEADRGYRGEPTKIRTPDDVVSMSDHRAKAKARARHETINSRLKGWSCLCQEFRHKRNKHKLVFTAIAVCTQLGIRNGESPFQVTY